MTNATFQIREYHADRITRLIPRRYRAQEAALLLTKWPAYCFLSPLEATRKFQRDYIEAYRIYCRTNIDLVRAEKTQVGQKIRYTRQNAHLTQLWIARQMADHVGLPYPAYLEFAFDFASRRRRSHAPQPNQLGPNPKTLKAWEASFERFWTDDRRAFEIRRMAPMPQYAIDHDLGLPAQRRFREELVRNVLSSDGSLASFVGNHVLALRHLRIGDCLPLGREALSRAEAAARSDQDKGLFAAHEYARPGPEAFLQSCFAIPGIDPANEATCADCPQFGDCIAARRNVVSRLVAETGSPEPIDDSDRKKTRERVARHRARKKLEAGKDSANPSKPKRQDPVTPPLFYCTRRMNDMKNI